MSVKDRVQIRIPEIDVILLDELILTATDRINMRVNEETLPKVLETVAVEVVVALYNRRYYEGIKSENADTFSLSFVDNILEEYEKDFQLYLSRKEKEDNDKRGVVRFL